ncbi:MAG: heavy-metal-associated domain-containing protein [bacterium]|nr:heavy-metal-associated domain-containing protein [bacterium]
MEKKVLISGMKCEGCCNRVKNALKDIKGVKKVDVSLEEKKATITYKKELSDELIKATITNLGFNVEGIDE